ISLDRVDVEERKVLRLKRGQAKARSILGDVLRRLLLRGVGRGRRRLNRLARRLIGRDRRDRVWLLYVRRRVGGRRGRRQARLRLGEREVRRGGQAQRERRKRKP